MLQPAKVSWKFWKTEILNAIIAAIYGVAAYANEPLEDGVTQVHGRISWDYNWAVPAQIT